MTKRPAVRPGGADEGVHPADPVTGHQPPATGHPSGTVLVVGGGIGGMQAALDLAESGFQVVVAEQAVAVGGNMVRLDRTFPTNDCSMCTISPRLVALGLHPNIRLLTGTTVVGVAGDAPRFAVTLRRAARYLDTTRCTACGECEKVCPVTEPNGFNLGLGTRRAIHKLYPQAVPNAYAIDKRGTAPCRAACPAAVSVQGYVALTRQGKYAAALELIRQDLPFPSVCGRVCTHPCETACARREVDEPVAIRAIKRFLADHEAQHGLAPLPCPPVAAPAHRVAIVGAGPAGLAAAYFLAREGIRSTVFEALPEPGGMLRSGVPAYRLPREVLAAEIEGILGLGVELVTGVRLGRDFTLPGLLEQGFSAIFLAMGAARGRPLGIPGEELSGVQSGVDFLQEVNLAQLAARPRVPDRVVVIGGGNVAIDAARTARRLGASRVALYCLEGPAELPAHPEEVAQTLAEGITLEHGWGPLRILGEGRAAGVRFRRCTRVFDDQHRFAPQFDDETQREVAAALVIVAIGQTVEPELLAGLGLAIHRGRLAVDPVTLQTSHPRVFAGGDAVTGPQSAIEAIAMGKRAAASLRASLTQAPLTPEWGKPPQVATGRTAGAEERPRATEPQRDPATRVASFEEVVIGLTEAEIRQEAERCLSCGACAECYQCVTVCEPQAIHHDEVSRLEELTVGSIILAPGFEQFEVEKLGEFGHGRLPNVLTSLEFERLFSSSGPTAGQLRRPSDGQRPRRIAWIQCAGSRDVRHQREYCSAVCCLFATKQAILTREHDPTAEATIFFLDLRAYGKGYEGYFEAARQRYGVHYRRCLISKVDEDPATREPELTWIDEAGHPVRESFDLLVLSTGLKPSPSVAELARTLAIDLDQHGFAAASPWTPGQTRRPGVFVAGVLAGPRDIPETVMSASGAAALSSALLREVRGHEVHPKQYPTERSVAGATPRVGVFVCRCGINIARVVDVPDVVAHARTLPGVVHAEENLYTCAADTQHHLREVIREHDLNRVVVASCTPRTHEALFRETCRDAGLNRYLFEMANIRDQCSWVHGEQREQAQVKARELVTMAVGRAVTLEPLTERPYPVTRRALILGGGLAGLTAAESLAAAGFGVVLVEREAELGGSLRRRRFPLGELNPEAMLAELVQRLRAMAGVELLTGAQLLETSGHVGQFRSRVRTSAGEREVEHGVLLVATGAAEFQPTGRYGWGTDPRILTSREFELRYGELPAGSTAGPEGGAPPRAAVLIQCVGSREPDFPPCSRTCCTDAMRHALWLKERWPGLLVVVLYRDIRTYGLREELYARARRLGVLFIRFEPEAPPVVERAGDALRVRVRDPLLDRTVVLEPDLVVLSTGLRPDPGAPEVSRLLKLPLGQDGFFLEAHLKLRPLDTATDGIFLCGLAHGPKSTDEVITQARGAAGRAGTILSREQLFISGQTSRVDPDRCAACLTCVRICPYHVPLIRDRAAFIEPASCQGCGACVAACPRQAIRLGHVTEEQLLAKVGAGGLEDWLLPGEEP